MLFQVWINWVKGLFHKRPTYIVPSYLEVLETLTLSELNEAYRCLEILSRNPEHPFAYKHLVNMAKKHHWSPKVMIEVIADEYDLEHNK